MRHSSGGWVEALNAHMTPIYLSKTRNLPAQPASTGVCGSLATLWHADHRGPAHLDVEAGRLNAEPVHLVGARWHALDARLAVRPAGWMGGCMGVRVRL